MPALQDSSFRWTDPHTWPWIFYVWILFALIGQIPYLWRRWKSLNAKSWPQTAATINSTHVDVTSTFWQSRENANRSKAELNYSYFVAGSSYSGKYIKKCDSEDAANEFVRGLAGAVAVVHYDPAQPANSMLLDSDLQSLIANRPPVPQAQIASQFNSNLTPSWLKPFIWIFISLAALGLLLSLWVHINALLGHVVIPDKYFFALHAGVFVVFIPAVLAQTAIFRRPARQSDWKVVLRFAPPWMLYMVYVFFAYAFLNFAIFIARTPSSHSAHAETPPSVWRGFSGHWMLLYSAALAILYSVSQSGNATGSCANGHRFSSAYSACPQCGSPAQYSSAANNSAR